MGLICFVFCMYCVLQPTGFMEVPLSYAQMEDMYPVSRWDSSHKYCIRIVVPDGSLLLQVIAKELRYIMNCIIKRAAC